MMTSSNRTIFRVTGHLCGEFTGHRWIPHKGQWRVSLMFTLICAWIKGWINNGETGDLRRHRAHYNVTVSSLKACKLDYHWYRYWHVARLDSSRYYKHISWLIFNNILRIHCHPNVVCSAVSCNVVCSAQCRTFCGVVIVLGGHPEDNLWICS